MLSYADLEHACPAIICVVDGAPVKVLEEAEFVDLQFRAEIQVAWMGDREVAAFELERARVRKDYGLPPVPVTSRGKKVMTARQYRVSREGFLALG